MGLFGKKETAVTEEQKALSSPTPGMKETAVAEKESLHSLSESNEVEREVAPEKTDLAVNAQPVSDAELEIAPENAPETALAALQRVATETLGPDGQELDESHYPTGAKLAVIIMALMLSVLLMALDNTIIATAIPRITDQFKSLDDVGWYGSAYLLTTCALQLFFGKLYTFYSIKWVYLSAIFVFEVGSAVCGAAPTSEALIIGRAVAGLGSAGIFSGALTIIAYSIPLRKRPLYTGLIGACYGIASIVGPLLGGAFTDGPGWPWCFYINLPLGAVTMIIIILFFKSPERKIERKESLSVRAKQLDLGGVAVFITCIITILLALQWGGSKYPWSNWRVILCLTLFGVLLFVFIGIQWYMGDNATIPFRIISQRDVAAACLWSALLGGSFFVLIYWVPIWFQAIKNASALKSGIMCLPMVLALVLANIVTGGGTTAIGYTNPFYYASVVFTSIGAGLLTTFTTDIGAAKWIGYQIIYGLGTGFGMTNGLITVQTVLPLSDIPVGTALVGFMQTFGGALFVSVAQNVFNNGLIKELVEHVPGVDPMVVISTGATSLKKDLGQQLSGVQLAYNTALTHTWYISVALSCATVIPALFFRWKSIKGEKKPDTAEAAETAETVETAETAETVETAETAEAAARVG